MDIGLNKRPNVVSYNNLKQCICAQFLPPRYRKELLLKLQRLHQGNRSADEYVKDLKITLTKSQMHDESCIVQS